jgi:hypothetical protein
LTSGYVRMIDGIEVVRDVDHTRQVSRSSVIIATVTDVDPEELEHIARSLAMAPVLGERDRQAVIEALRRLAAIERAKRRDPRWPRDQRSGCMGVKIAVREVLLSRTSDP